MCRIRYVACIKFACVLKGVENCCYRLVEKSREVGTEFCKINAWMLLCLYINMHIVSNIFKNLINM
jgi:hypothetical protein